MTFGVEGRGSWLVRALLLGAVVLSVWAVASADVLEAPASRADRQPVAGTPPSTQVQQPARSEAGAVPDSASDQDLQPGGVVSQDTGTSQEVGAEGDANEATSSAVSAVAGGFRDPTARYGLWVLLPAVVAILLAIFTRQVVPSLVVGILVGAYMMLLCLPTSDPYTQSNPVVGGFRMAMEKYVLGAIHEWPSESFDHLKIIVFTLVIGFVVGVIGRNGGTRGMVQIVAGQSQSKRRGALTAWLAGLVVFFDDYANTMIVGPTMRSVFDRVKLSRAKLAYIVDSTAAPVSSIALIGTWVGTEVSLIDQGLNAVAKSTGSAIVDASGAPINGMQAFLYSIPYRFYPLLALFLVFLVAVTGRDFGPMKKSERRALGADNGASTGTIAGDEVSTESPPCWWQGLIPILILVLATVGVLVATGYAAGGAEILRQPIAWWQKASGVIQHADSYIAIFYGAILAAFAALLLTILARACPVRDAVDAGLDGMARMMPALVILVLAWSLSHILQDLKLAEVVKDHLQAQGFQARWLPLAVFTTAAFISFATGTSWGTMGILCPVTVTTCAGLVAGMEPAEATPLLYAAIGSVLAGAVFGDHCSPISDTTVLSSIASGCRHEEHVWTQIPYALVAAIAAMGLGDMMCSAYKQPWYYGLGAGAGFLLLVVLIVGRRTIAPVPTPELQRVDGQA